MSPVFAVTGILIQKRRSVKQFPDFSTFSSKTVENKRFSGRFGAFFGAGEESFPPCLWKGYHGAIGIFSKKKDACDPRLSKKSFRPKDSEGRIVGKGTVRVPFP